MIVDEDASMVLDHFFMDRYDTTLDHHGVKGMKWGVRKKRSGHVSARATMSRGARKDRDAVLDMTSGNSRTSSEPTKFEKKYNKTYRRAQGKIRKSIRQINANPKYKGQNFRKDSPLRTEYYNDVSKAVSQQLNASAAKHGRLRKVELNFSVDVAKSMEPTWTLRQVQTARSRDATRANAKAALKKSSISHADGDVTVVKAQYDELGHIVGFDFDESLFPEEEMEHGSESILGSILVQQGIRGVLPETQVLVHAADILLDDYLEHYGVLGMKWGVRKDGRPQGYERRKLPKNEPVPTKKDLRAVSPENLREIQDRARSTMRDKILPAAQAKYPDAATNKRSNRKLEKEALQQGKNALFRDINSAIIVERANKDIAQMAVKLNKKYAGQDVKVPGATRDKYLTEFAEGANQAFYKRTKEIYGRKQGPYVSVHYNTKSRFDETPRMILTTDPEKGRMFREQSKKHLQHAEVISGASAEVPLTFDPNGFIIDIDRALLSLLPKDLDVLTHAANILVGVYFEHSSFSSDSLTHYGVKGMKWGVRKRRPSSGPRKQSAQTPRAIVVRKTATPSFKRRTPLDMVTNEELKRSNERLRLEKEYNTLIAEVKRQNRTKGQVFFQDKVLPFAEQVAKQAVSSYIKDVLKDVTKGSKNKPSAEDVKAANKAVDDHKKQMQNTAKAAEEARKKQAAILEKMKKARKNKG